jgi:hypothetical protein
MFVRSFRLRAGSEGRRQFVPEGALIRHDKVLSRPDYTPWKAAEADRRRSRDSTSTCSQGVLGVPHGGRVDFSRWDAQAPRFGASARECVGRASRRSRRGTMVTPEEGVAPDENVR